MTYGQFSSLMIAFLTFPMAFLLTCLTDWIDGDPMNLRSKFCMIAGGWFALAIREYSAWLKRERRKTRSVDA
jgi:hypothetical protein